MLSQRRVSESAVRLEKLADVKKMMEEDSVFQSTVPTQCMVHKLLNLAKGQTKGTNEPESAPPELADLHETKHNLSEMVMSVRDLSKNLSNLSMKIKMHNVLIVSKIHDSNLVSITHDLVDYLLSIEANEFSIYVQDIMKELPQFQHEQVEDGRLKFWDEKLCRESPNMFDLVITLGGDGTVLFTSWLFQKVVPPVLCFGLGSLGFMTEYNYENRKQIIPDIIDNGLKCSLRMRFECTIMRAKSTASKTEATLTEEMAKAKATGEFSEHTVGDTYCILNDIVVDRGPNATITTTELYGNCNHLTAILADGVVIATPSGSTAYSLSAGGSLVHPDIPAILISPICPHTLSFRPLVLPDSLMISVGVPYDARATAWCSFDGRCRIELNRGDFLTISASQYPFPMVQDGQGSITWFSRLSQTLHWNERKRQVPYS